MTDNLLKAAFFFAVLMVLLFQSLFSSAEPATRYRPAAGKAGNCLSLQSSRQSPFDPYHDACKK